MTAGVQIDVTGGLIGILWVMKSCLYDRWPRLWYRKIMWSLAMATKVKSGNHRAIRLLIDSSSIPRDRKQAELSIRALTPITPPLPFSHYIFNFTVSTFSVTLFVNSPTTSAHSASSGFFTATSPPTNNPDCKDSRSRSSTRCASSTRFTSSTRTTARLSAPWIGSVPQRSGSHSSSILDDESMMPLLLLSLVLDNDDGDEDVRFS